MRGNWRKVAALALVLVGANVAPAIARISGRDQAATNAFIAARARYLTEALGKAGAITQAATAFVDQVAASCQNSLASLPSTPTSAQRDTIDALGTEASFDFSAVTLARLARDLRAQSNAFAKLRWSRASLNRVVATYLRAERKVLSIASSDLCSDIAAASATSFAQPGPGTITLLNQLSAVPSYRDPAKLLALMRPFETAAARAKAKRVNRLSQRLAKAVNPRLTAQWSRLVTVLFGSSPPPGATP